MVWGIDDVLPIMHHQQILEEANRRLAEQRAIEHRVAQTDVQTLIDRIHQQDIVRMDGYIDGTVRFDIENTAPDVRNIVYDHGLAETFRLQMEMDIRPYIGRANTTPENMERIATTMRDTLDNATRARAGYNPDYAILRLFNSDEMREIQRNPTTIFSFGEIDPSEIKPAGEYRMTQPIHTGFDGQDTHMYTTGILVCMKADLAKNEFLFKSYAGDEISLSRRNMYPLAKRFPDTSTEMRINPTPVTWPPEGFLTNRGRNEFQGATADMLAVDEADDLIGRYEQYTIQAAVQEADMRNLNGDIFVPNQEAVREYLRGRPNVPRVFEQEYAVHPFTPAAQEDNRTTRHYTIPRALRHVDINEIID